MKHSLLAPLALALLSTAHLAHAQTAPTTTITTTGGETTTITTTTDGKTTTLTIPDARQLLKQIGDSYDNAQTIRAAFDVSLRVAPNAAPLKMHFQVLGRSKSIGADKEATDIKVSGTIESRGDQAERTFQLVSLDDGRGHEVTQFQSSPERDKSHATDELSAQLKTMRQTLSERLKNLRSEAFSPVLSLRVEGAQATFIVTAQDKQGQAFRAVVDAQTRNLISLDLADSLSIQVVEQRFDTPISDSEFALTPAARQTNADAITSPLSRNSKVARIVR